MTDWERENFFNKCYLVVGTNGSQKTLTVRRIIQATPNLRTLIVNPGEERKWYQFPELNPEETPTFTGIRQMTPDNDLNLSFREKGMKMLQHVVKYYKTGNLVVDDCRLLIESELGDAATQLVIKRRQLELIVFAIFHSLAQVPPRFYDHSTHIILFKTSDNKSRWWNKVPSDPEKYEKWIERVNRQSHSTPGYCEVLSIHDPDKWSKINL